MSLGVGGRNTLGFSLQISSSEGPCQLWLPFPNGTLSLSHVMDPWQWGWNSWSQALKEARALESERVAQIHPVTFIVYYSCHFGWVEALPHLPNWAHERANFCPSLETFVIFKGNVSETAPWKLPSCWPFQLSDSWETGMSMWCGVGWIWVWALFLPLRAQFPHP